MLKWHKISTLSFLTSSFVTCAIKKRDLWAEKVFFVVFFFFLAILIKKKMLLPMTQTPQMHIAYKHENSKNLIKTCFLSRGLFS